MKKFLLLVLLVIITGYASAQTRSVPLVPESFSTVYAAPAFNENEGVVFPSVGYRNGNIVAFKDLLELVGQEIKLKWKLTNTGHYIRGNIGLSRTNVSTNDIDGFISDLNQWLYTTITVNADFSYSVVTYSDGYNSGSLIDSKTGAITDATQQAILRNTNIQFYFWDTYDGNAFLTLGELIVPDHSGTQYSEFLNYDFEGGSVPPALTISGSAGIVSGGSESASAFYMQGNGTTSDYVEFSTNNADMITFDVKLNHSNSYRIVLMVDGLPVHSLSVYDRGGTNYPADWCEVSLPVEAGSNVRVEFTNIDGQDLYLDNIRFYQMDNNQTTLNIEDVVLDENTPPGTMLKTASLTNATGINYLLELSDASAGGNALFAFDGDNLEVQNEIDYEVNGGGFPQVIAFVNTENILPLVSTTFGITVNDVDEAPSVLENQVFDFDEKSDVGTSVGIIAATDEDDNDASVFSIVSGNEAGLFNINAATGELTVADGIIDFNDYPQFSLVVRATDIDDALLFGEAPVVVNVNDIPFSGGAGTEADPFQIKTPKDLDEIRNYLGSSHADKYYILVNDIDLQEYLSEGNPGYNEGAFWDPIGDSFNSSFRGTFLGNNFSILNFAVNRPEEYYIGLWGVMYNASVSDLSIEIPAGSSVRGQQYVGALSGEAESVNISRVNVTGAIYANASDVGGVIGYFEGGVMENCQVDVTVSAVNANAGGVVGRNWGTITKCFSEGTVVADSNVGGLVGMNDNNIFMGYLGAIAESYSKAVVSSVTSIAGGLVGYNVGTISNCFVTGSVDGPENTGGFIGSNAQAERDGFMGPETVTGTITNCYSATMVNGSDATIGGFAGVNDGDITSSYWDINASGMESSAGGTGLNGIEMREAASFADWDFTNIWGIDVLEEYVSYPYLLNNEENPHPGAIGKVTVTSWPTASDIVYGQVVGESVLSGGAVTHEGSPVSGNFYFMFVTDMNEAGTVEEEVAFIPVDAASYLPVIDGSTSLNVLPKPVSVMNAVAQDKIYDGTTVAVVSDAVLEDNAVEGEDDVVLSNHTSGTFAQAGAGDGITVTTNMTLSGTNATNYDLEQPVLTASISKASLTVTADDQVRLYGEVNPELTFGYSGFVNEEDASVLTTLPTVSTQADESSNVGDYAITAGNGLDENYDFSYVDGVLSVNPAPLTVKAIDVTRLEGEPNPEFELEYTGFVNGEDQSVIDFLPGASCDADEFSEPGDYLIIVSPGDDGNYYFIVDNTGVLTVTTATSVVPELNGETNVFPVPADTYLFVSGINIVDVSDVEVVDMSGRTIKTPYSETDNGSLRIDVSSLKSGIYFLKIRMDEKMILEKIVVL